jgi:hypothetical protein
MSGAGDRDRTGMASLEVCLMVGRVMAVTCGNGFGWVSWHTCVESVWDSGDDLGRRVRRPGHDSFARRGPCQGGSVQRTPGHGASLLRTCIDPGLGMVRLTGLTADGVREWHYELGLRLAAALAAERDRLVAAGRSPSAATVRDGRTRQAQAYRLLRAAMAPPPLTV